MPYSSYTLDSLATQIGTLLDDENELFWAHDEKVWAIVEALRVWGAMTSYWRARGAFTITQNDLWSPAPSNPWPPTNFPWLGSTATYYDLSQQVPNLRPRTYTLNQMVREIQAMFLEPTSGVTGVGMTDQVSIQSVLLSIQRARNRFVLDAKFPLTVVPMFASPPPPDGLAEFAAQTVFVHKASWQDAYSGIWTNLWREDAWASDHGRPMWTLNPGMPNSYSEAELAPLKLQMVPAPVNEGLIEALCVLSLQINTDNIESNGSQTFNVPDEWSHAIKYAAVADMCSAESQNKDPMRAQYAEMRYSQAMMVAREAKSILRVMLNNVPLPLDSLFALDSGSAYWRNQRGMPFQVGCLYDLLAFNPLPDNVYGVSVDVAQSAPIPQGNAPIQIGNEDITNITDYVTHALTFKCGGKEFQDSFAQYDSFMKCVGQRGGINKAKIKYLTPLFEQGKKDDQGRADEMYGAKQEES